MKKKKEIHRKFWRAIIGHRLKGHDTDEAEVVNNQFLHNKKISVLVFSLILFIHEIVCLYKKVSVKIEVPVLCQWLCTR